EPANELTDAVARPVYAGGPELLLNPPGKLRTLQLLEEDQLCSSLEALVNRMGGRQLRREQNYAHPLRNGIEDLEQACVLRWRDAFRVAYEDEFTSREKAK